MITVEENCKCGAKFKVSGGKTFCAWRYGEFLKAHETCRCSKDKQVQLGGHLMILPNRPKKIRWHITSREDSRWDSSGIATVTTIFQMPTKAKAWTKNCEEKYGKRPKDLEYSARKIYS